MSKYFILFLTAFFIWSACGKKTGNTTEQKLKAENFRLRQENDSLKRLLTENDTLIPADTLSTKPAPVEPAGGPKLAGRHDLTLQWISWENPGSVMITAGENGWYTITGQQTDQKNPDSYLRIKGKIRAISPRELEFEGTIETKVQMINSGEPCIRTGRKIFKATGSRKYWRLQDMINCEGGMVTDYVDIYF